MIQLSYHPAFDAFHCIFRMLRIKQHSEITEIEVDRLRILDYYVLFPWRAADIRLPRPHLSIRRTAKKLEEKQDYATLPDGEALLERMRPAQLAALQTMAEDGVLDAQKLRCDTASFLPAKLPEKLSERVKKKNDQETETMTIIDALLSYPLLGNDGLKARTSLLEYRYDKV